MRFFASLLLGQAPGRGGVRFPCAPLKPVCSKKHLTEPVYGRCFLVFLENENFKFKKGELIYLIFFYCLISFLQTKSRIYLVFLPLSLFNANAKAVIRLRVYLF